MVDRHQEDTVPWTLLHGNLRPQSFDQVLALFRGQPAEFYVHALTPEGGYPCAGVADEEGLVAIQIWFPPLPIVRIALSRQVRAADMFDKDKRPRAHDIIFIPM